jgi:hypothetical protein
MPSTELLTLASLIMTIIMAITALVGAYAVIGQLRDNSKAYKSSASGELYSEQSRIHDFFISKKHLRPYFMGVGGKAVPDDDKNLAEEVALTAEMMADFFEHIWLKQEILPEHVVDGWKEYIRSRYEDSPAIRKHFEPLEIRRWYTEELLNHLGISKLTEHYTPSNGG